MGHLARHDADFTFRSRRLGPSRNTPSPGCCFPQVFLRTFVIITFGPTRSTGLRHCSKHTQPFLGNITQSKVNNLQSLKQPCLIQINLSSHNNSRNPWKTPFSDNHTMATIKQNKNCIGYTPNGSHLHLRSRYLSLIYLSCHSMVPLTRFFGKRFRESTCVRLDESERDRLLTSVMYQLFA